MNLYEIKRYSASHPDWEGSFSERLYEYCEWDKNEFWKLHKALIDLAVVLRNDNRLEKELAGEILGIQRSIYTIIIAHYNPNDVVKISNITEDELRDFKERLDTAVSAIFTGTIIPEEKFDLVNPLLC